jgi:ubiquinone/menaquinone biosynthesis C-methylase UbiE
VDSRHSVNGPALHLNTLCMVAAMEASSLLSHVADPSIVELRQLAHTDRHEPFLACVPDEYSVNWSQELEQLHEDSSRTHFIDVWTRRAMLARLGALPAAPTVLDLGCSSGYLLEDLRAQLPHAQLIGIDLIASGLRAAHAHVPDALLLQADVCSLPLNDACIDVIVSANLLEHVPDDQRALAQMRRILRPGGRAVIVVPVGPHLYDYYDRLLGHQRRYARRELATKANRAGLTVLADLHLGAPLYPAFWLTKKRNRRSRQHLSGHALERTVKQDIDSTGSSPLGRIACRLEELALDRRVHMPFGIRGMTVLERPPVTL